MARRSLKLQEGHAPVWDRLLTMLFLAALLHGLIILGLTFSASAGEGGSAPGLEVLLTSDELPEADKNPTATYLAQRTQLGSGNTREAVAPHNRSSSVPKARHAGTPDGNSLAANNGVAGSRDERVLTTVAWNTDVRYVADEGGAGTMRERPLLVDVTPAVQPGPQDEEGPAKLRGPERDELWVTPDTRAATLAPYLDAWRRKVERIGTINYPSAARGAPAQASPVVEVGIASTGTLDRAVIRRSSGNPELDQAALAILKLASPFDPFPPELAAQYRVLRFAYEWQFVGGRVARGTLSTVHD
jgi:periplasmic protein TonB